MAWARITTNAFDSAGVLDENPSVLTKDEAQKNMPKRLTDKAMIQTVMGLDSERIRLLRQARREDLDATGRYELDGEDDEDDLLADMD